MFAYYFSSDGIFAPHILFWEAFVALALLGFGFALLHLLRQEEQPLAIAGAAGISVWIFLGGWLNLAHAATKPALINLLCLGNLLAVYELVRKKMHGRQRPRIVAINHGRLTHYAGLLLGLYFVLTLLAHLRPTYEWNVHDDLSGYMGLAEKTSALGGLHSDPFSERRIATGLGGGIFLDATMLAGADDSSMGFLDAGFGYVLYLVCLWSVTQTLGLSRRRAIWVFYLVPLLPLCKLNLTIIYLSTAFFLAILLLLLRSTEDRIDMRGRFTLIGLIVGAASTLKSSNIPFLMLLLFLCAAIFVLHKKIWTIALPYLMAAIPFLLTVFPWSLKFRMDEGTWFFPTLGRGDHISAFGILPLPSHGAPLHHALLIALPNVVVLAMATVLTERLTRERPSSLRIPVLAFMLAATASVILISITLAGEAVDRYSLPLEVPALLLCTAFVIREWNNSQFRLLIIASVPCAAVVLYANLFVLRFCNNIYDDIGQILTLVRYTDPARPHIRPLGFYVNLLPSDFRTHADSVRRAQLHIPPGETILETNSRAYGYDWRRNNIYMADYPGMASLPPGMPILGSSEDVRHYLLDHGIHYLMIDRGAWNVADFDYAAYVRNPVVYHPLSEYFQHPFIIRLSFAWSGMEARTWTHTAALFSEIAANQPTVYMDGDLGVISLLDQAPADLKR